MVHPIQLDTSTRETSVMEPKGFINKVKTFFKELNEEINRPLSEEESKDLLEMQKNGFSSPYGPYGIGSNPFNPFSNNLFL